jgi:hypothetical protein
VRRPRARETMPVSWTSRPADALVGRIEREHAADASARLDDIFADRLDGYRERRFERRRPGSGGAAARTREGADSTTTKRGGKP